VAPFAIAENYDSLSSEGARANAFSVTREFSNPCNSAEVQNIPNPTVLSEEYIPGASGDDGFTTLTSSGYPPTGTATADTDGASVRIERTRVNNNSPETHTYTPTSGAGGSDGTLYTEGTAWPPGLSSMALDDTATTLLVQASKVIATYYWSRVMLGFDTSAIPNDAEVISATLTLKSCTVLDVNTGSELYMAWMDKDAGAVELDDWEDLDRMIDGWYSARSAYPLSAITATTVIDLEHPALGIQKTKYSWIWMNIGAGSGIPTGENLLQFDSADAGANAPVLSVTYRQAGTDYTVACAMLRFDTSALPADAEIQSATLWVTPSAAPVNADGASIGLEWYDSANWPIGAADHTNTATNAAGGYTALSGLALDTECAIAVSGGAVNINLAGYTGLRVHVYTAATPTGENSIELYAYDNTTKLPRLVISYISGGSIIGTAEDAASQSQYGVFKTITVKASLASQAEANLEAAAIVAERAWPQQAVSAKVERNGLRPGQYVHIAFPALGVDEAFLIRSLSASLEGETPVYAIEAGDFRPDLIQFLRLKLAA
jgi:hypothetical protein